MEMLLERAPELMKTQSPSEYLKGLAVASRALQQARAVNGKVTGGGGKKGAQDEARSLLDELRGLLEPEAVEAS
jgi:hypothetical protein